MVAAAIYSTQTLRSRSYQERRRAQNVIEIPENSSHLVFLADWPASFSVALFVQCVVLGAGPGSKRGLYTCHTAPAFIGKVWRNHSQASCVRGRLVSNLNRVAALFLRPLRLHCPLFD